MVLEEAGCEPRWAWRDPETGKLCLATTTNNAQLIDPLLKAFTDKTGIKANVVYASAGLNERLAAEGANSPADRPLSYRLISSTASPKVC